MLEEHTGGVGDPCDAAQAIVIDSSPHGRRRKLLAAYIAAPDIDRLVDLLDFYQPPEHIAASELLRPILPNMDGVTVETAVDDHRPVCIDRLLLTSENVVFDCQPQVGLGTDEEWFRPLL